MWKREPLSESELTRLIDATETLDEEFTIQTLAKTGLRADEFSHLKSEWIDWQKDVLRVPPESDGWTPKTSHAVRSIPIKDPDTRRVMRRYFEYNESVNVSRQTVYRRVVRVAERTNITKKVTPHVLRHTYGTLIASRGATAQYIRQTMGHADLSSANTYLQYSGAQLDEEAESLW